MEAHLGSRGLRRLVFLDGRPEAEAGGELFAALTAYFHGEGSLPDIPLDLAGTPFQVKVWRALLEIPFGQTVTYGGLARRLGVKRGARAVGLAVGQNPIAIIVPCHRVLGSEGELRGYAYGLQRKKALLALESGQPTLLGL
jgi:methylated-DNA-[protein]-cysteine S-methyltransferase